MAIYRKNLSIFYFFSIFKGSNSKKRSKKTPTFRFSRAVPCQAQPSVSARPARLPSCRSRRSPILPYVCPCPCATVHPSVALPHAITAVPPSTPSVSPAAAIHSSVAPYQPPPSTPVSPLSSSSRLPCSRAGPVAFSSLHTGAVPLPASSLLPPRRCCLLLAPSLPGRLAAPPPSFSSWPCHLLLPPRRLAAPLLPSSQSRRSLSLWSASPLGHVDRA